MSVGDAAAVTEGDDSSNTTDLSFPVTLSAVSGQQVTVTYTLGGTATADDDYTDPATKSVTIAAGTRTANILVPVKGDVVDELNETVIVTLSGATNATVSAVEGADEGEGTITDDDDAELSIADGSAAEGSAVSFTIGLDPVSDRTVTVRWSTANDADGDHPATAGTDYTAVSTARTATIAAGASGVAVTVQTTQDSLDEPDETFLVELSSPVNATLDSAADEATGTITDNDGATATVSVGDAAAVTEGDDSSNTTDLSFPVTLSAVSGQQVTVTYTLGGTATADDDYTDPATKSVTIAAGTRTANILVPVKGDVVDELNETVIVTLSGATNATVSAVEGADEGEGTITDDDDAELSIADGSAAEGSAVSFTIGLDPVSDRTVTVRWSTANDADGDHPATAGTDYTAVSTARTATIAAGASGVAVTVQTTQDSLDEPDETFLVELSSPVNATLDSAADEATGTITDNDGATATVSVGDAAAVTEGDDSSNTTDLSFPVTLSAVSGQQVTVTYTLGGTATADDDYTDPATKSVTIAAGTRTANILVPVKGDVVDELNETVIVTLSGATNATVSAVEGADEGEGTITDDDDAELSIADGSAAEGSAVSFTIGLDPVSDRTVTVRWSTANDADGDHPATAGTDYTAVSTGADGHHRGGGVRRGGDGADHPGQPGRTRRDLLGGTVLAGQRHAGQRGGRGHRNHHRQRRGDGHGVGGGRGGGDRGRRQQ